MKTIKKITDKVSSNFSSLAGSALLVGATLTGGAAFAAASSHGGSSGSSMDLGDYPHPFVDEDGQVQTSIVLGSDAQVTDVVGATEIAGSLGAAAFGEESIATSGGNFGWTADNGVTLDTRNDQLYFGDDINTVRNTLTQNDLNILEETTFRDDSGTRYDITSYLNVDTQPIQFDKPDSNEDPVLNVNVPAENSVDNQDYLYSLQANMDSVDFSNEDVQGEDIELFGTEYTVAENQRGSDEIVLYGSSQEVDVQTGSSTTVTINEREVTLETVSVNAGGSSGNNGDAAVRVDGNLRSVSHGDTINVDGETIRVDEIIKTGGSQSSDGFVNFRVGSEELRFVDGGNIEDSDGDDVEGTYVQLNGDSTYNADNDASVSSIEVFVGAEDDDEDYLEAGETFTHSAFPGVEVHFGGLNPDTTETGDSVSAVELGTDGDDTVSLDFTAESGDATSINYAYSDDTADADNNDVPDTPVSLADSDGDAIQTVEGAAIQEDEYFLSDAGDFSHMWEVTGIDRDTTSSDTADYESGDEAEIDIRDAVTGNTVTVDLEIDNEAGNSIGDDTTSDYVYEGTEIIDGQKYYFELENEASEPSFYVAWGDSASEEGGTAGVNANANDGGLDLGDETSISPALDTETGASVAFFEEVGISGESVTVSVSDFTSPNTQQDFTSLSSGTGTVELDLSEISAAGEATELEFDVTETSGGNQVNDVTVTLANDGESVATDDLSTESGFSSVSATGNVLSFDVTGDSTNPLEIRNIEVTQASSTGTVTANNDLGPFDTANYVAPEVSYTGGESVDLSGYEFPSTESTDAQTGAQYDVTFDSTSDSAATVGTISGITYEMDVSSDNLRPAGLDVSADNPNAVASALILPEDDNDNEQAYVFEHGYDSGDEELDSKSLAQAPTSALQSQTSLESDSDVSAGYDFFGTYHEVDSDDQGSITLHVPEGQSVAGAAVTGADGSLSMGGGSGSVDAASPTYQYADGLLTDDGNVGQARDNENLILVGGPAANSLTQDLVDDNQTMPADDYTSGQGMIQMVDGFSEGNSALVVAGATGEDTRAAAEFLADYRNNADSMEGQSQVTIETQSGTVVE